MPTDTFQLFVMSAYIAAFDPNLEKPFNDWSSQHIRQGFSWRSGSVSFSTLDDVGDIRVSVRRAPSVLVGDDSERAIVVPFTVGPSNIVEIAGLDRGERVHVAEGSYALLFETGFDTSRMMWCRMMFVPSTSVEPQILRADSRLSPEYPLLMEARPAGP